MRYIYEIADHERKVVYIGLTINPMRRLRQHRSSNKMLIAEFGKDFEMKILTLPLEDSDAAKREGLFVTHYLMQGYRVLNRVPTGGLGYKKEEFTKEYCKTYAKIFSTRGDFRKFASSIHTKCCAQGWLDEVCEHMTKARNKNGYWTIDKARELALSCKTRTEFNKKHKGAYQASHENGWLDEICSHMVLVHLRNNHWTDDKIQEEALKYTTRNEFSNGCKSAYSIASKRGILDKVCSHMPKHAGSKQARSVTIPDAA